ncbi:MAG: hypothetical protein QNL62_02870 [Gammaproteobacteria bacterium]|nr:hypothetical protein [Gammaproteobacteria bacterium]
MQKISENKQVERIPKQFENNQDNFCKKPTWPNFGIPAKQPEFGTKQVRGDNVLSLFVVNTMANNSNIDSCEAITTLR